MGRSQRERGQAVTAITMVATLVLVWVALNVIQDFSKGNSELSKLKSSADAAALAGAHDSVGFMWGRVQASLNSKKNEWKCGDGRGSASEFANRNDATLTRFCYTPGRDRVEATTRTKRVTATGDRESATSVAELGIALGACTPDEPLVETTSGYQATATCGDLQVKIYVPPTTEPLTLITPEPALKAMFRVRLVD